MNPLTIYIDWLKGYIMMQGALKLPKILFLNVKIILFLNLNFKFGIGVIPKPY